MSDWMGLLWYGVLPAWGLFVLWQGLFSKHARRKWKTARAKTFAVDDFPEGGYEKVVGCIALTEEPLIAPHSKRPCVFYNLLVEESYLASPPQNGTVLGRSEERWRVVSCTASKCQGFLLEADRRQTLVEGGGDVRLDQAVRYQQGSLPAPRRNVLDRLASSGVFYAPKRRFREGALVVGSEVTVCGWGTRQSGRLVLGGSERFPLSVGDL